MRTLLLAAMLLSTQVWAASPGKARRAVKKLNKAQTALDRGDLGAAMKHAAKATELNPESGDAFGLVAVLYLVAGSGLEDAQAGQLLREGAEILEHARSLDASSQWVAAGDGILSQFLGKNLLPDPPLECSPEAHEALGMAEQHFSNNSMQMASQLYEQALALCPTAVPWWTWYGDAAFRQGDYDTAMARYQRSIDLDPCYAQAHRFTADAHENRGDLKAARLSAAKAVSCNPTYQAGWTFLEGLQGELGGALDRVQVEKPTNEPGVINMAMQDPGPFGGAVGLSWAVAMQGGSEVQAALTGQEEGEPTPLQLQTAATRMVLSLLDGEESEQAEHPFWQHMARAEQAGFLEEAVLVMTLDESLVDDFLKHREQHPERLEAYVLTVVAPLQE